MTEPVDSSDALSLELDGSAGRRAEMALHSALRQAFADADVPMPQRIETTFTGSQPIQYRSMTAMAQQAGGLGIGAVTIYLKAKIVAAGGDRLIAALGRRLDEWRHETDNETSRVEILGPDGRSVISTVEQKVDR